MKAFILTCAIFGFFLSALAQPSPQTMWWRVMNFSANDYGVAVCPATDGGFAIAGCTNFDQQSLDCDGILVRVNGNGDTLWVRYFPGSPTTIFNGIQATADHGFIIAGFAITPQDTAGCAFLTKIDSAGFVQWTRSYGGPAEDSFSDLIVMPNGDFVCTGYTTAEDEQRIDIYLVRTTSGGDIICVRTFPTTSSANAYGLCTTTEGGYAIVGTLFENSNDAITIKTDIQGELDWMHTYGGTDSEWGTTIQPTTDGGYLVGCTQQINNQRVDVWLVRTDRSGDTLWTTKPVISGMSTISRMIPTNRHGFIVSGTSFPATGIGDMLLMRVDSIGHSVWTRRYMANMASESGMGLCMTDNFGFVMSGCQYYGDGSLAHMFVARSGTDIMLPADDGFFTASPRSFALTAYPNPFNPSTTLAFSLPEAGRVTLTIHDLLGREAQIIAQDELFAAGEQQFVWDASALPSGVYFARMTCGTTHLSKKLLLLK